MRTKKIFSLLLCLTLTLALMPCAALAENDETVLPASQAEAASEVDGRQASTEPSSGFAAAAGYAIASARPASTVSEAPSAEAEDEKDLFERIMACETPEAIEDLIAITPEEELKALSEEQAAQLEAYMEALMPAPLPAIVIEESEPPVASEVCRPTVNYIYAAPLADPVTGGGELGGR